MTGDDTARLVERLRKCDPSIYLQEEAANRLVELERELAKSQARNITSAIQRDTAQNRAGVTSARATKAEVERDALAARLKEIREIAALESDRADPRGPAGYSNILHKIAALTKPTPEQEGTS